ncbi:MAG: calcium-binding protein, partial [Vicinamibacterales bacterium]
VNLLTNATDGAARGMTISGFENLTGTDYGDELTGTDGPNLFMPLHGGGPVTVALTSGPDRIDGKGGLDTLVVDYSLDDAPAYGGISSYAGNRSYNSSFGRQTPGSAFWSSDSVFAFDVEQFHITGASKNDQLTGGIRGYDDILSGLGGNDILGGYGGSDTLLGGDGNDVLTGEGSFAVGYDSPAGGHDVFDGGAGDDLVEDIGFDFSSPILAADALFQLDGGSGFDTLSADFSNQTAAIVWDSAAPTNVDFADGAYFRNFEALRYFVTGSGNDSITQRGRIDNAFYLGAGDDVVNAGIGVDNIDGGAGNDLAIIDFSVGDTADMGGVGSEGNADGGSYFRGFLSDPFNRPDRITLRSTERVWITGTSKADSIVGTYGDDRLIGGDGNDTLDGNRAGNNYLDGGAGDDSLIGAYPNYNGPGTGGGNDTLLGGPGNDTIFANHGNDILMGGDGNDVLSAGDRNGFGGYEYGVDVIDGGAGDDVVIDLFQNTNANAATRLKLDGGAGFDTLSADYGNQTQAIVFIGGQTNSMEFADGSYLRNFEQLGSFASGSGNDTIILSGRGDNFINTGGGDDTVNPGLGIDSVLDLGGNNLLILDWSIGDTANAGPMRVEGSYFIRRDLTTGATIDSVLVNGVYSYRVTATSKDDVLTAYIGDDVYFGGAGNDSLSGNDGNDSLYGEVGNDTLNGENGDDLLDGGPGADTMTGGAGNDTYYVDNIADIINEGAGGGYDTVIYTIGGSFTQPANIEKIIFMGSTTLPSLTIGANGIVILGGETPPSAQLASALPAADGGLNEIAHLQAQAGTPSSRLPIENTIAALSKITASAAHDTPADIAIAKPMTAFPELFASEFQIDADTTHDWHHDASPHEAALAPFDFDVIDAIG